MLRRDFLIAFSSAAFAPTFRKFSAALIETDLRPQQESSEIALSLRKIPLSCVGSYTTVSIVRYALISDPADEKTFLGAAGPASEALNSSKYAANGYWRGPVWAPSTYLIYDGLRACGELSLAREIAERFCNACAREPTFSENYNAITGTGQYDSGMTWSAAEFLLLAKDLKKES